MGFLLVLSCLSAHVFTDQDTMRVAEKKPAKRPLVAGVMSGVVPGSGQFYIGEKLKGTVFLGAAAGLLVYTLATSDPARPKNFTVSLYLGAGGIAGWSVVDAVVGAKRINSSRLSQDQPAACRRSNVAPR